jgi:hypothetical protein
VKSNLTENAFHLSVRHYGRLSNYLRVSTNCLVSIETSNSCCDIAFMRNRNDFVPERYNEDEYVVSQYIYTVRFILYLYSILDVVRNFDVMSI